jgi:hypothetical protein
MLSLHYRPVVPVRTQDVNAGAEGRREDQAFGLNIASLATIRYPAFIQPPHALLPSGEFYWPTPVSTF